MTAADSVFAGSIPALYDRYMVPLKFAPYAADLARRTAAAAPDSILETAAGTGVVTAALAKALPGAAIVATDLNPAMLEAAAARVASDRVRFQPADAQALPFADASFDAVVCQFGVMFFPDRVAAFAEARRVLKPGGRFLFNAWDRIEANAVSLAVTEAVEALFSDDLPSFFRRVPHGYHDPARIEAELRAAGFAEIAIETVGLRSRIGSAREAALGLVQGTPLRAELEARDPARLEEATQAAATELALRFGLGAIDVPMSAHVVVAH